jgi:hypothetical protein
MLKGTNIEWCLQKKKTLLKLYNNRNKDWDIAFFVALSSLIFLIIVSLIFKPDAIRAIANWITATIAVIGVLYGVRKFIMDKTKHEKEQVIVSIASSLYDGEYGHNQEMEMRGRGEEDYPITNFTYTYKIINRSGLSIYIKDIRLHNNVSCEKPNSFSVLEKMNTTIDFIYFKKLHSLKPAEDDGTYQKKRSGYITPNDTKEITLLLETETNISVEGNILGYIDISIGSFYETPKTLELEFLDLN